MQRISEICLCLAVVFIFSGRTNGQTEPFLEDDVVDDTNLMDLNKRGWSMLRLGRGLQMLRLGKRGNGRQPSGLKLDHVTSDYDDLKSLSSNDLQAMLNYLLDEPRDDSRRQPPLPRYGRDSSNSRRSSAGDNSDLEIFRQLLDKLPTRQAGRPAPRGGRYKRSVPEDYYLPWLANYRSLLQAKAVPMPRFGRVKQDKADVTNNDQSKNSDTV